MLIQKYYHVPPDDLTPSPEREITDSLFVAALDAYFGFQGEYYTDTAAVLRELALTHFPRPSDAVGQTDSDPPWRAKEILLRVRSQADDTVLDQQRFSHQRVEGVDRFRILGGKPRPEGPHKRKREIRDYDPHRERKEREGTGRRSESGTTEDSDPERVKSGLVSLLYNVGRTAGWTVIARSRPSVDEQLAQFRRETRNWIVRGVPLDRVSKVQPSMSGIAKLIRAVSTPGFFGRRGGKPFGIIFAMAEISGSDLTWRNRSGEVRIPIPVGRRIEFHGSQRPGGPYLIAVTVLPGAEPGSWEVGRIAITPIVAKTIAVIVQSDHERDAALALLEFMRVCGMVELILRKPLPGEHLRIGDKEVLPDFIAAGPGFRVYFEVRGSFAKAYVTDKKEDGKWLATLGDYVSVQLARLRGEERRAVLDSFVGSSIAAVTQAGGRCGAFAGTPNVMPDVKQMSWRSRRQTRDDRDITAVG